MVQRPCPICGSKGYVRGRCPSCGYDEDATAAGRRHWTIRDRIARAFHLPLVPEMRANIPWRRPLLAAGMGMMVMGAGHMYVGKWRKGIVVLAAAFALAWATINVHVFALFFLAMLWSYQIVDAYDSAVEFDWNSIFQAEMREASGQA